MFDKFRECPQCGRPFEKISASGKAGFCAYHEKWFPYDASAQSEANELNQKYKDEIKELEQRKRAAEKSKKRKARTLKATAVLLVGMAAAAAILWFRILPEQEYNDAVKLLRQGVYGEALERFSGINYRNSEENVMLCEAFLALADNNINVAIEKIDQIGQSEDEAYEKLKESVILAVADWKAHEITPEGLLLLLPKVKTLDKDNLLDTETLSIEAHVHMLNEDALDWYVKDMDEDGEAELVVLQPEQIVTVYRMNLETNEKVVINENAMADCLVQFGDRILGKDADEALVLYQAAYKAASTVDCAKKLGNIYQKRASEEEAEKDYEAALTDAKYAYDLIGEDEAFQFLYDMEIRKCYAEADKADGLQEWAAFADVYSKAIERHGLSEDYKLKTAEIHLEYAKDLASHKDPYCVEEFKEAYNYGADIYGILEDTAEVLDLCKTRIDLRKLAVEISETDIEKQGVQKQKLKEELIKSLQEWERLKIDPQDVFVLIEYAKEIGIEDGDTEGVYHSAALKVASEETMLSDYEFIDWNQDGREELLAVTEEGVLEIYAFEAEFKQVWNTETDLQRPAIELVSHDFLLEAEASCSFASYSYGDGKIQKLIGMEGLTNYKRDGKKITFGKPLNGSIERNTCYEYSLDALSVPPTVVEIDWQEDQYPYPETPEETIQRFFEAKGYGIEEEAGLLQAEALYGKLGFGFDVPEDMPEAPYEVESSAYYTEAGIVLEEVRYQSEGKECKIYAAVIYDSGWKIVGFSDAFAPGMDERESNTEMPLLSLNAAVTDKLQDSEDKHIYRMLLPEASRVQMFWKAGEKQGKRTAFYVSLYDAEDLSEALTAYELKLSPARQMATPLFLKAGVYYIQVEAKSYEDCEYELTMEAQAEQYVEQEENNNPESANAIEVNQEYRASLFQKNDVDCFVFRLDAPGAVDVVLQADDIDSKKSRYEVKLFNLINGRLLSQNQMLGNVKTASMGKVYLSEGQYMVQVSPGKEWSSWDYGLTVVYQKEEAIEQERNDTPDTATQISLNTAVSGSFGIEGDVDCYSLTLDQDMVIQPKLAFAPLESSSKTYVLTVLGETDSLFTINIGGKESGKVIAPIALKAGTYTIKLENPQFIHQDYSLTVAAMQIDAAEAEPNDTLARATELAMGQTLTGVLSTQEDIDWYRVSFSEDTMVTLSFQFEQTASSKTAFALQLEQNGKSQWSVNVKGESGGLRQKLQIPAGEYYLRVKAGNRIGAVYTVGLENIAE